SKTLFEAWAGQRRRNRRRWTCWCGWRWGGCKRRHTPRLRKILGRCCFGRRLCGFDFFGGRRRFCSAWRGRQTGADRGDAPLEAFDAPFEIAQSIAGGESHEQADQGHDRKGDDQQDDESEHDGSAAVFRRESELRWEL